jgi:hypothetical protein
MVELGSHSTPKAASRGRSDLDIDTGMTRWCPRCSKTVAANQQLARRDLLDGLMRNLSFVQAGRDPGRFVKLHWRQTLVPQSECTRSYFSLAQTAPIQWLSKSDRANLSRARDGPLVIYGPRGGEGR